MADPSSPWPEEQSKLSIFYQGWLPPITLGLLGGWEWLSRSHAWYPPVGTYIAILGVVAFVVTIWPPQNRWGKGLWLLVVLFLVAFEINNLYRDRDEHDTKEANSRKEEREAFQKIADGINAAILTAQHGFDATASDARKLTNLSSENIKMITGGDSFCYMFILADTHIPVFSQVGRYPLYGVEARIVDLAKYTQTPLNPQSINPFSDLVIKPGDMPVGKAWINSSISIPFSNQDKQDFNIFIGAKNGSWTESLRLRRIHGKWESAMQVLLEVRPKSKNEKTTFRQICETISEQFPQEELDPNWRHTSKRPCR